jgi:hypothetical protein
LSTFTVTIDHPDAAKLLKAAIEGYAKVAQVHADYAMASKPHDGETTTGQRRRAQTYSDRAKAMRSATITPGGQAG